MTQLEQLQTAEGDDTDESRRYEKQIRGDRKKWKKNSDKIRQNLVESLCENPHTKLMAMEFKDLPTAEFYDAVTSRVKDTSSQSLNYRTGILNAMKNKAFQKHNSNMSIIFNQIINSYMKTHGICKVIVMVRIAKCFNYMFNK